MSYKHIDNLYKTQDILMFRECYATEKIHGTSAHISWKNSKLSFFSGGVDHLAFMNLFNKAVLIDKFMEIGKPEVTVFGEAYGGKCQGMSGIYGKELRFVGFEVKIGKVWLCVPDADDFCHSLELDFVPYGKCSTELDALDFVRDLPSEQSVKCGIAGPKKREGIVLRPLIELRKNNGKRIVAKYKTEDFQETQTPRQINEEDLKILEQANDIAREWVTEMRLTHVLDNFPNAGIEKTGDIIKAMIEDIERESEGEIVKSKKARKAISKRTANLFKNRLSKNLKEK